MTTTRTRAPDEGAADTIAETMDGDGGERSVASADVPSKIGRYHILRQVDEGAMGTIYLGYDESLDRRVAVKVHRGLAPKRQAILQREAQAMARLSHPNVAQVFEVGAFGSRMFMAMEYVDGQRLTQWQHETGRRVDEILARYVEAGRGLAAAHVAGLVHRDFKPDNVLVGDDGRVRVVDFGLALQDVGVPSWSNDTDNSDSDTSLRDATLAGIGGTPAYMSPEQFHREPPAASSDQFSFCVALFEALYGERPFEGDDAASVAYHVPRGDRRPRPHRPEVPGRVREALERGLSLDPADRFASMNDLLAALAPPSRGRSRWVVPTLAVGVIAGAAAVLGVTGGDDDRCADAGLALGGAWDDARREAVQAAVLGTDRSYAADTWDRLDRELSAYADAWRDAAHAACEATHGQGVQTEAQLDRRMACLDGGRRALDATTSVLAEADATVVENALDAAQSLPDLEPCADLERLSATLPPPSDPDVAARVEELRDGLARTEALQEAGKISEALALAENLQAQTAAVDWAPVKAEIYQRLGHVQFAAGQYPASEASLRTAYDTALRAGHMEVATNTAATLAVVVGAENKRFAEGRTWLATALPLAEAEGLQSDTLANVLSSASSLYFEEANYRESIEATERALEIDLARMGPDSMAVGTHHANLGAAYRELGEYEQAIEHDEVAVRITKAAYGPQHPSLAVALGNLAAVHHDRGELEQAEAGFRRVIEIRRAALGPDHPLVAQTYDALGVVLTQRGKTDEAREYIEKGIATFRASGHPESQELANALSNLAAVQNAAGEDDAAEANLRESLEIHRRLLGPDHPDLAIPLRNFGTLLMKRRRNLDEAREMLGDALRLFVSRMGEDHPHVVHFLFSLGQTEFLLDRFDDARVHLQRALDIADDTIPPRTRASLRFWLGRATYETDPKAGHAIASEAVAEIDALVPETDKLRTESHHWLSNHPAANDEAANPGPAASGLPASPPAP